MDNKLSRLPWLYGRGTSPRGLEYSVDDSVEDVDEAVIARLRHAIAVEGGDDEKELNAVLRMLGAEVPDKKQLPPFGRRRPHPTPAPDTPPFFSGPPGAGGGEGRVSGVPP